MIRWSIGERIPLDTVVLYGQFVCTVVGHKMDFDFSEIQVIGEDVSTTVHNSLLVNLGITVEDIPGVESYRELKRYFPEYLI